VVTKSLKILIIAPQPFYTERGTPMNVRLICQVLGEAGHEVDLLVFPTGQDITLENVNIIRVPNLFSVRHIPAGPSVKKLAFDFIITLFACCLLVTRKYDVIHGIEEGGFLAVMLGKLSGTASIFDMDSCISDQLAYSGFLTNRLFLKGISSVEKWSCRNSSAVISVCQALSDKARSLAPHAKIVQIEDIPLPDLDISDNSQIDSLLNNYDLADSLRVVYTGNLQSYQGIDLLLDAWKRLRSYENDRAQKSKLVVVGGPNDKIDHYRTTAVKKGIDDSICWVGQRPASEMGAWMGMSDALVSPRSDGDNTPLKIYSYMSSGRPIVATRRFTHTQVLDDSMAFLADPEPTAIAEAILDALTNIDLSRQKSTAAQQEVEEKYSYSTFSHKLLKTYGSITKRIESQSSLSPMQRKAD
jgi:glycosyltransferase involved in cell wall biosynthesis